MSDGATVRSITCANYSRLEKICRASSRIRRCAIYTRIFCNVSKCVKDQTKISPKAPKLSGGKAVDIYRDLMVLNTCQCCSY